jgi:hypothetical protein
MPLLTIHMNMAWFIVTAVITWNLHQIMPFLWTMAAVTGLILAQSAWIQGVARCVLGPLTLADVDAIFVDTHLLSLTFWFAIACTHASGMEFVARHQLLHGIQRLMRLSGVRITLWQNLSCLQKLRLVFFELVMLAVSVLASAYWATDPYDHATHALLLAEGMSCVITALFEFVFLLWTTLACDVLHVGAPDTSDELVLLVGVFEAIVHLIAAAVVTYDRPRATGTDPYHLGPPIPVQALMLKRIWLVAASYTKYSRSLSVLENVPDASPDDLKESVNCSICLEACKSGKRLPCGHIYHANCLRRWLMASSSCPLCRRTFFNLGPAAPRDPQLGEAMETARRRAEERRRRRAERAPAMAPAADAIPQPTDLDDDNSNDDDSVLFEVPDAWPLPFHRPNHAAPGGGHDQGANQRRGGLNLERRTMLDTVFGSPVRPPTEHVFPIRATRRCIRIREGLVRLLLRPTGLRR